MSENTFDPHTAHFLSMVIRNMPKDMSVDVMQDWVENPAGLQKALRGALCPPRVLKIGTWKRIKLGTGLKTAEDFRKAISDSGMRLGESGSEMLGKPEFTAADQEIGVDLVLLSVKGLGFKGNTCYSEICLRAKQLGLELCPPEVGPQLRLQYFEQNFEEQLVIAMEPILTAGNQMSIFILESRSATQCLYATMGRSDRQFSLKTQFVFVWPKKVLTA